MQRGGTAMMQQQSKPTMGGGRQSSVLRLALVALIVATLAALVGQPNVAVAAATRYVATMGTDTNNNTCTDSTTPCLTIGYALDRASFYGDTISIAAGTYNERLVIWKSVTLQGAGAGATIINGTVDGTSGTVVNVTDSQMTVTIAGVTITGGSASHGGGVINYGTLTLANSTVSGNSASYGGGVYNVDYGMVTLIASTLSGNTATTGGGVYNFAGDSAATLAVTTSTLSGNSAGYGGGVFNDYGMVTLITSTLSGNSASFYGGGVWNDGTLDVTSSTFSGNSASGGDNANRGGGMYNNAGATLTNTIIAASGGDNCTGNPITSGGHNLASDATCSTFTASGDRQNTDPQLGPLADNGGPTFTHLPTSTSPAIDAGGSSCPATDQRGVSRPRGTACDIGAVEPEVASPPTGDTTPPTIIPTVSGTLGTNGWYTSDVDVSWSVTDPESAISSSSNCDAVSIMTDQAATTYTCEATSAGGTTMQSVMITRDATAPQNLIFVGGITPGESYTSDSVPAEPTCTADDAVSGLASCVVTGYSDQVGSQILTAMATDVAGNQATSTLSYTVSESVAPLDIGLQLHTAGTLAKREPATVSGTVTCDRTATIAITGTLSQVQRRSTVLGSFVTSVSCDAATGQATWSAPVTTTSGRFVKGSATVSATATGATDDGATDTDTASGVVTLK